jgi:uncharacterized protein with HEPN domain
VRIISEAIKALSPEILAQHREVDWPKLIGTGNLLRHEYCRVDPKIMWDIAIDRLPELRPVIEAMLTEAQQPGGP